MTNPGPDPGSSRSDSIDPTLMGTIGLLALTAPWFAEGAQIAFVLTTLILVYWRIRGRMHTPPYPWTLIAVLAFLLVQAISIPGSEHPARSLRGFLGSWVLLFPFVFWPVLQRERVRQLGLFCLLLSGGLAAIWATTQQFQNFDSMQNAKALPYGTAGGPLISENLSHSVGYVGVLLPVFFLALGWSLDRTQNRRGLAGLVAVVTGLALITTLSPSTWIGLGAGVAVFALWRGGKLPPTLLAGLLTTGVLVQQLVSVNPIVDAGTWGGLTWIAIWILFLFESYGRDRSARVDGLRAGIVALLAAGIPQRYASEGGVAEIWMFLLVATLIESGRVTTGGRRPMRQLNRAFKRASLPLIARLCRPSSQSITRSLSGSPPQRILVVRQDNRLGNLVLMTPFLQNLRGTFPESHIAMVTGEAFAPLLSHWPWVDEWIVQPKRRHAQRPWEFRQWVTALGRGNWDVAFEMSNHNTHSYFNCVLTLASRAPRRIGFDEPRNQNCLTGSVPAPEITVPFSLAPLALLATLGVTPEAHALHVPLARPASSTLTEWRAEVGGPTAYIVVHLGGRGKKSLPIDTWKQVIFRIGERTEQKIVLVLGPDEREHLADSLVGATASAVIAPSLDLFDLSHLIAGAEAYLGGDTGVMHLAAALSTPTISLFFESNPYHYAPLGSAHTTVVLANPYGVDETVWSESLPWSGDSFARSRLVLVPYTSGREAVPRMDDVAIEAIVNATLTRPHPISKEPNV